MAAQKTEQIYCQIRKEWVTSTPEEQVRQKLIRTMMLEQGYPAGGLVLEKGLRQMPHLALKPEKLPDRRADIICFARGIHPGHDLYPLLLVECKAVKLTHKVVNQVAGYNHFLQAYFIAVANQDMIKTGWYDRETLQYRFIDRLPPYSELMNHVNMD